MDDAELEAVGLYCPAVDDPARADLIRRCLDIGLTVDEIREAGEDLIDLAVQRIHSVGGDRFTAAEVAQRTGLRLSQVEWFARVSGLVRGDLDEPNLSEHDVEMMPAVVAAIDLLGEDAMMQMIRVTSASVARIGDAGMSAFLTGAAAPALRNDASGVQLLDANVVAADLLARFGDMVTPLLRSYLSQSYRPSSEVSLTTALEGVDTRHLAIGFADLVGSTTLADNRTLSDLNAALNVFERTATETIFSAGGRVVKFIGDEVMFRAGTADVACAVAGDLIEAVRSNPLLPPLRVGIAFGEVLTREGDFYGPIVNLAARVTKLAPLHGVVATLDTTDALDVDSGFAIQPLGAIEMPGLAEPVELAAVGFAPA